VRRDKKLDFSRLHADTEEFVSVVPLEIDTHYQMFGKHMWEVEYYERCSRCDKRIDEYGFCACNGVAE
jgi:phosphorylcholine metabolism protein LicD